MVSGNENLMGIIEDVKSAEKDAEHILEEARKKAEEIQQKAKEEAVKLTQQAEREIVELKDSHTREGRMNIDKEVKKILSKAEKDAGEIKKKRLGKNDIDSLVSLVFE